MSDCRRAAHTVAVQRTFRCGTECGTALKNKLTANGIKNATDGKLYDGSGLMLVKKGETGKWVFRYSIHGRRRDMGLGAWPALTLANARKERDRWLDELAAGADPKAVRDSQAAEAKAAFDRNDPTFAAMVETVFEARKEGLRGQGKNGRWMSPLKLHLFPKIGRKRMSQIHQTEIRDALKPIWKTKHPTAQKAIQRTRIVFRDARLSGVECDPFTVDAAQHMLGVVNHRPKHIEATPWQDIPALYERLSQTNAVTHLCLRFLILTAVRSHAARGARFEEIDDSVWTVPADRIKGQEGMVKDFRVPLSIEASRVVKICAEASTEFLFPSVRPGRHIWDASLDKAMNDLRQAGRPHGLRTSFRTWVQDNETATYDVTETALGHVIGGKVERAYARSDLIDQRRALMQRWADFVTGEKAKVVRIR